MEKDFDLWSGKKKRLHNSPRVGDYSIISERYGGAQ